MPHMSILLIPSANVSKNKVDKCICEVNNLLGFKILRSTFLYISGPLPGSPVLITCTFPHHLGHQILQSQNLHTDQAFLHRIIPANKKQEPIFLMEKSCFQTLKGKQFVIPWLDFHQGALLWSHEVTGTSLNYGSGIGVTEHWKHVLLVTTQSLLTFHLTHQICYLVNFPENETHTCVYHRGTSARRWKIWAMLKTVTYT